VRFAVASWHAPLPAGTAPGRILRATCDGLREVGHSVEVWVWGSEEPRGELPDWCHWRPVPPRPPWRMHLRALTRPRTEVELVEGALPDGDVAIADDPASFPAVARRPRTVAALHYSVRLDAAALHRRDPGAVQDRRLERRVAREAGLVLAYSDRVAATRPRAVAVPVAYPTPAEPLDLVEAPVAAIVADWRWRPNEVALDRLAGLWPAIRRAVPGAELLVAGYGAEPQQQLGPGISVLGPVPDSREVLARAAVLAFPCPPTSGPKVKVLEAMAIGLPVVTTPAGVEGLAVPADAAAVASVEDFATTLADTLADPDRRATQARAARAAVARNHSPATVARRRVELVVARWPELDPG
jgi:glycosyltransferase involved in cell wall biosynthesis